MHLIGRAYCEDRESPWLPRAPAVFGGQGMPQAGQGRTALRDLAKAEGAFGPLAVPKCQTEKEYTAAATAITASGASARSVNLCG